MSTPSVLAAQLQAFGNPAEVLRLETLELPLPAEDELQLEMLAAPINPADLNTIAGTYGKLPTLPATIGNEGLGRILAAGSAGTNFQPGDLVATTHVGCWCSHRNVPADAVIPLPAGIDPLQGSMLCVNPPTAYGLLTEFAALQPGDWIVQNAANSGVGRAVIQLARKFGIRTLNIVRRPDQIAELLALGADAAVLETADLAADTPNLCDGTRPRLAFNSVGGASALNLANALAPGGIHVTYGAMARQPLKIPAGLLIFQNITFRGFWLRHWLTATPPEGRATIMADLADLIRTGVLHVPVAATYPLKEIHAAIAAAAAPSRPGKVLLDLLA